MPRSPLWVALPFASLPLAVLTTQCGSSGGSDGGNDTPDAATRPDGSIGVDACGAACDDASPDVTPLPDANPEPVPDAGVDAACDPAACASGACLGDGGGCAPPCSDVSPCGGALTCCNGRCADLQDDPTHCGACGVACTSAQFCTGAACFDTIVQNACKNASAVVIADGIDRDDVAGELLHAAFAACVPSVSVTTADGGLGAIDPATGRPLAHAGTTDVAAGGPFGQKIVGYYDTASRTPIYVTGNGTTASFVQRSDGGIVATTTGEDPAHDWFVVMLATDAATHAVLFSAYGFNGAGTSAGGWYAANVILPTVASEADAGSDAGSYRASWYVYEWTDQGAPGPDAADTFVLRGSGNSQ